MCDARYVAVSCRRFHRFDLPKLGFAAGLECHRQHACVISMRPNKHFDGDRITNHNLSAGLGARILALRLSHGFFLKKIKLKLSRGFGSCVAS